MRRDFLKGLLGLLTLPFAAFQSRRANPADKVPPVIHRQPTVTAGVDVQRDVSYITFHFIPYLKEARDGGLPFQCHRVSPLMTLHLNHGESEPFLVTKDNAVQLLNRVQVADQQHLAKIVSRLV